MCPEATEKQPLASADERVTGAAANAGETGDESDKFAACEWRRGPGGLPLLGGCPSWFAGRILERLALGDHTGLLLEPFDGADDGPRAWLPFSRAKSIDPGHEA